jgi:hypothetical protein
VLQKGCHYCTQSGPFYQQLTRKAEQSQRLHLIAVLPQRVEEGTAYLKEIGVTIPEIRQAKLRSLQIRGTPTILLIGGTGVVEKVWVGKLDPGRESDVLQSF